jgi:TATA-binding protein-associated factor
LGKTLQALLGIALAHAEGGPDHKSIVICPATLVRHWEVEVYKYFPCRKVFQVLALLGSPEERSSSLKNSLSSSNLLILSYAVLRSDIGQIRESHQAKWCYCVLDEGHLLKNPETGRYEVDIPPLVAKLSRC